MSKDKLELEALAFDDQINERIENGHIPDLRYTEKCDYFYNNPWRHPEYVKLDFGEQFTLMDNYIKAHFNFKQGDKVRLLEVGCGPGYLSLEFARSGYDVTGIDVSSRCIQIAEEFAEEDPHKDERLGLNYEVADLFQYKVEDDQRFDVIVFLGALHHFKDQQKVMDKVNELLSDRGIIVVHEPTRDRVTFGNAAFYSFLKTLLSVNKGYYVDSQIPSDKKAMDDNIQQEFNKLKYETDDGSKVQSVNDNEAGYKEMSIALKENFEILEMQDRYAYFHEMIGGLRFDEETNLKMARYLRDMDEIFCKNGVLQPTEFFLVGKKK